MFKAVLSDTNARSKRHFAYCKMLSCLGLHIFLPAIFSEQCPLHVFRRLTVTTCLEDYSDCGVSITNHLGLVGL